MSKTYVGVILLVMMARTGWAAEPVKLATVEAVPSIVADEPRAQTFSLQNAARYLDRAALDWQKSHACTSCHTMFPYLMARPALNALSPQSAEVRTFFEDVVAGKTDPMPDYQCHDVDAAVSIGVASALAMNDRSTTGKLHPLTRQVLDKLWTLQRPDGSWEWPFRDTPPLKTREHYGTTLAAVAAGMAPDNYAKTDAAIAGLERIRTYLHAIPPICLHERAMVLWASTYIEGMLTAEDKSAVITAIMTAQRPDGGWSLASFVDNTSDPSVRVSEQATKVKSETGYGTQFLFYVGPERNYKSSLASDGYATGFAIFVARQAGVPATDARLQRGIAWLKANQRESGRWFTPSQAWHSQNLIANAGTGYAVLALAACGEVPAVDVAKSSANK